MKLSSTLKYWKILINSKINKKIQRKYVYVPKTMKTYGLTNFSDFWIQEYVDEVIIVINSNMSKTDKEVYFKIIKYLTKKRKKIIIREEIRIFNNEDIHKLSKINSNIIMDNRYMEKSNTLFANEILTCKIVQYLRILRKIAYFKERCNKICNTEFEKVVFTIVQLADYITYAFLKSNNDCLTNGLLLRYGVCIDFSITLCKCLEELGIECDCVGGLADENKKGVNPVVDRNHAWNQVKINDKWYNVELTWFSTSGKDRYLLANDEVFYENGQHKVRRVNHVCKESWDRDILKNKIDEYRKYNNVFKEYDKENGL